MKKYMLILVFFILHSSNAETNVINGTYGMIDNPATTDPILPGLVAAVTANNVDYILTVNGYWFWEEFSWEGWTPEWDEEITVIGDISEHEDLFGRTYYEIEISDVQAGYTYTTNNGAITITGYTGPGGDISIPSAINGLPVTSIESGAFSHCTSLTSVTIPDSVTSHLDSTFYGCSSLTNVTIGSGVTSIGLMAFDSCTSLTDVTIHEGITTIDDCAFYGCSSLTNVTIGSGVTFIGWRAFGSCASLTDVTIREGVTTIVESAFISCTSLSHITLPESITHIGDGTFRYCNSLTNITADVNNAAYSSVDGILFNKDQTVLVQYPVGKSIINYTIPGGVTAIEDDAFDTCNNLISVTIPDSVTNVGICAFGHSDALTGVYFRGNAPSFGYDDPYSLTSPVVLALPPWTSPFVHSPNVIVYYLPGTTGWGATFGECPTAVWKPQIEVGGENFRISTNQFGFNIVWASNQVVVVEANTSLTNSVWQPLQTNTLGSDSLYFSDAQWTNYPNRFYRISSP